jgi:soluble lytic murein transglycosylase-like protein
MAGDPPEAKPVIPAASPARRRPRESAPRVTRSPSPAPQPSAGSRRHGGSVRDLIVRLFPSWAVGTALCVAFRESRFDPGAYNPGSGAAGVFQWIASTWAVLAPRAGFAGASRFDPVANVAVAAWRVRTHGWSDWRGGHPSCGIP